MALLSPRFLQGPGKKFGDPFLLPSTETFPSDIRTTLDLCLYLFRINRIYGAVCNRVVSYFITDIEFPDPGDAEEQKALTDTLVDTLGMFSKMQQAGQEWAIYGNGFVQVVEPFDRWLIDKRGGTPKAIALSRFPEDLVSYDCVSMKYTVPDLSKATSKLKRSKKKINLRDLPTVELDFRDKPSSDLKRFSVCFLDPRYIELDKAHHSESIQYIYRIPPDMESRIRRGILHEVNNTPRGLLKAVSQNKDFRFRRGEIYHFRPPTPTGVSDSGWAVPEILMHYDSIYQLQVYRRADFAIAQDYLLPFRVFTPGFDKGSLDSSVMQMVSSKWMQEIKNMITSRRQDPTHIHALPFPAQFDEHGGDGKRMVMFELVEAYTDALFDGLGFPRELFRGSMNVEQLPNAIRMFERHYEWLFRALEGLLQFVSGVVQRAKEGDFIQVRLKRPTMAYTAEWLSLKMQLAANREIPRSAVYPDVGVPHPESAAVQAAQEDQEIQRELMEMQANFEKEKQQGSMADVAIAQAEQGAAAAAGMAAGQPGVMGGAQVGGFAGGGLDYSVDPNADPLMIQQRAQEIAMAWQQMHEAQPNSHRQEMQRAEAINPTLYAAAKNALEKIRSGGASVGRSQASQVLAGPPS